MEPAAPAARPGVDIGEALNAGWRRFWPNLGPMLMFAVIVWVVQFLINVIQPEGFLPSLSLTIVGFVVSSLIGMGWIRIALDITDGRPVTKDAVMESFGVLVPYLVASLVFTVALFFGFLLLIVPGIIIMLMWMFYGFHIVDTRETNALAALRRSAEITKGHRGQLFLLGIVLILFNILGLVLLLVGVLITSGISLLAVTDVYRRLAGAPADVPADPGWSTS